MRHADVRPFGAGVQLLDDRDDGVRGAQLGGDLGALRLELRRGAQRVVRSAHLRRQLRLRGGGRVARCRGSTASSTTSSIAIAASPVGVRVLRGLLGGGRV